MDSQSVIMLWAELMKVDPDEAAELLSGHVDLLEELADYDVAVLRAVAEDIVTSKKRLPISDWHLRGDLHAQAIARQERELARQTDVVEELLARAVRGRVVVHGDRVSEAAVLRLRERAHRIRLEGIVKEKRRWPKPRGAGRITLPTLQADEVELHITRILNVDGIFSLDSRGFVFITQQKGYQRDEDDRIYVDGVSAVLDDAADVFISVSPEGGRLRLTGSDVRVHRDDRPIANLQVNRVYASG